MSGRVSLKGATGRRHTVSATRWVYVQNEGNHETICRMRLSISGTCFLTAAGDCTASQTWLLRPLHFASKVAPKLGGSQPELSVPQRPWWRLWPFERSPPAGRMLFADFSLTKCIRRACGLDCQTNHCCSQWPPKNHHGMLPFPSRL